MLLLFLVGGPCNRLFLPFAIMGTTSFPMHNHVAGSKPLKQSVTRKTTLFLAFSKALWWWVTRSSQHPKANLLCSGCQWSAVHGCWTAAMCLRTCFMNLSAWSLWTTDKRGESYAVCNLLRAQLCRWTQSSLIKVSAVFPDGFLFEGVEDLGICNVARTDCKNVSLTITIEDIGSWKWSLTNLWQIGACNYWSSFHCAMASQFHLNGETRNLQVGNSDMTY